jgi:hypothetical protein
MKKIATVGASILTFGVASCSTIQPVRVNAGESCFRCQRTISDTRLAGERIAGFIEKFRAPGCMAKYIVNNPGDRGPVYVTDFRTGTMLDANAAFFVPVVVDPQTGERDYRAYARKPEADAAALELKTSTVRWNAVLERARQS